MTTHGDEHGDDTPEGLSWRLDADHFPRPVPWMLSDYMRLACDAGFNATARTFGAGVRLASRRIAGYHYATTYHAPVTDAEAKAALRMDRWALPLKETWDEEWLPEVQRALAYWSAFDLENASEERLLEHLARTIELSKRIWTVHFLLVWTMDTTISLYHEAFVGLFGSDPELGEADLLRGESNRLLDSEQALWNLSRIARESTPLRSLLASGLHDEALCLLGDRTRLDADPVLARFAAEWGRFLDEFGRRSSYFDHLTAPSWTEDPWPVLTLVGQLCGADVRKKQEPELVFEQREQAQARLGRYLARFPVRVRKYFLQLLDAARTATALHETHNYWIDQRCVHEVRRVVLAIGRCLVERGSLERVEDTFELGLTELSQLLGEPRSASTDEGWRSTIEQRKLETAGMENPTPPNVVEDGDADAEPSGDVEPSDGFEDDALFGVAASAGIVEGIVRVVHGIEEVRDLTGAEVLVTTTTAPAWSLFFSAIAAFVTETGGRLSHCAIVAREHGIPCVVAVPNATRLLRDGDRVEVDGTTGAITLVARASG